MAAKFIVVLSLAVAGSAFSVLPYNKVVYAEPEAPAYYQFEYSVQDTQSSDVKQQKESREGNAVQGSYSLIQPDGVQRIVDYTSDKENGFNAAVRYEGQPIVQSSKIAYAATPVAKIAYAAPVTNVAYATPIAKVAYPTPIAKVAYTAPVAEIAYNTALLSQI